MHMCKNKVFFYHKIVMSFNHKLGWNKWRVNVYGSSSTFDSIIIMPIQFVFVLITSFYI